MSEFIGIVGDKQELKLLVKNVVSKPSRYGKPGSCYYVNETVDGKGNCVVWQGSKELTVGSAVHLKATIKDHKRFKGNDTTYINRPTIIRTIEGADKILEEKGINL